jgi:hypothetical protein
MVKSTCRQEKYVTKCNEYNGRNKERITWGRKKNDRQKGTCYHLQIQRQIKY